MTVRFQFYSELGQNILVIKLILILIALQLSRVVFFFLEDAFSYIPRKMFGFDQHLSNLIRTKKRNLPRVLVRELSSRLVGSTICQEFRAELFFIDQHRSLERSALTLMGLRSQRLFWESECAFANFLNLIRSNYGVRSG